MNDPDSKSPRGLTLVELFLLVCVIIVLAAIVDPLGLVVLFFTSLFLFGWISFLLRMLPQIHPSIGEVLSFGLELTAAAIVLHLLVRSCFNSTSLTRWKFRRTVSVLSLFAMSFIAGISFVGAVYQAGRLVSDPSLYRSERARTSRNNLKCVVLGFHEYHENWNTFPAGGTMFARGIPGHSCLTALLPYVDENALFQMIDRDQTWLDEKNKLPFSSSVSSYVSPYLNGSSQVNSGGYALTLYASNSHLLSPGRSISFDQITDGASNTLFTGEVHSNFKPWGDPSNSRDPALGLKTNPSGFGNPERDEFTCFSIADGTVRLINNNIDPKILKALATPDGGEAVGEF